MSTKRKIVKIVSGIFFTLFLTSLIFDISLIQITEYDTIKPIIADMVGSQLGDLMLPAGASEVILSQCEGQLEIEFPIPVQGLPIDMLTLNCEEAKADLNDALVSSLVRGIYYTDYGCEPLQCMQSTETAIALFSYKTNEFLKNMMYILLLLTALSAVGLVLSCQGWGIPKTFGVSMIFVGLAYPTLLIIGQALPAMMMSAVPAEAVSAAQPIVKGILDMIAINFLPVLIIGIILTSVSIIIPRLKKKKKRSRVKT